MVQKESVEKGSRGGRRGRMAVTSKDPRMETGENGNHHGEVSERSPEAQELSFQHLSGWRNI